MRHRRKRSTHILRLVLLAGLLGFVACEPSATPPTGDGTTAATAGASCWGIKQQHPASPTGSYWLWTAQLDRPTRFHCDMTTDGGGWVLVGRGRNGWTWHPDGQGTAESVRTAVDGPAAFAPAALDTATINGLLGGTDLSADIDGIRLERSLNPTGSTRQDYRLFPRLTAWKWSFEAGQLLNRVRIDGTTYNGSNTRDTSASVPDQVVNQLINQNNQRRMFTSGWSGHGYQMGFSLGATVTGGSSSATNHLWTAGSEGSPIPFTRVWLRPRLANQAAGHTPIPAGGFSASAKPATLKDRNEAAPWGVVGYDHTGEATIEPWNTTVLDIRTFGDRVYVGGRFTGVQRGPSGSPNPQRFLAAFDLDGNWISTFRPTLDGRVWDMVWTPDGKLIIGGDFTVVNGQAGTAGMAALDPITGASITSWKGNVRREGTTARALVRSLETRGDWIYAGGRFSRLDGGTATNVAVPNTASLRTSNGQPGGWRPQISASAVDLAISADGTRVYLAGFFNAVNGDTNHGFHAITNIADGTPVPGMGPFVPAIGSGSKTYQQAVAEANGNPVVGGSQHDLQLYSRNRTSLLDAHITRNGGDFQAIEVLGGWVYAGCHCYNWNYSGTNNYPSPNGFRDVDNIRSVGRWDPATFRYDPGWLPYGLKGNNDEGLWGLAMDRRGCLWIGGDYVRGAYVGGTDWLGGFARYCPEDATPPTTPTDLRAGVNGTQVELSWGASTDGGGAVSYDVYRGDRIIATTSARTFVDAAPGPTPTAVRYTVRAVDARGNRSASPAPITPAPAPVSDTVVLPFASTWRWYYQATAPAGAWTSDGYADSGWAVGRGELGFGDTPKGTVISTAAPPRPLTSYYRTSVTISNPSQYARFALDVIRNSGVAIYVNGVEVSRINLPAGPLTASTYAVVATPAAERKVPVRVEVPSSAFRPGTNTISAELHLNYRSQPTAGFDLQITGLR
jgi:hypothetical protein